MLLIPGSTPTSNVTQWTLHCTRYFATTSGRWTKGWLIFWLGSLDSTFFSSMLASDRRPLSPWVFCWWEGVVLAAASQSPASSSSPGRPASNQCIHPSIRRPSIPPSIGSGQAQSSLSACIQAVEIDVRYPFRLQRYSVIHYSAEPVEDVTRMRKEHLQSKRASSSPGLMALAGHLTLDSGSSGSMAAWVAFSEEGSCRPPLRKRPCP